MRTLIGILVAIASTVLILGSIPSPEQPVEPWREETKQWNEMVAPTISVEGRSKGTGVILFSEIHNGVLQTFALTNYHVVKKEHGGTMTHILYKDRAAKHASSKRSAEVVAYDTHLDLALLKLADVETALPVARIMPAKTCIAVFTPVWTVGAGGGFLPFPTQGIVSSVDIVWDGTPVYLSSTPTTFGNSGGGQFYYSHERHRYEMFGLTSKSPAITYHARSKGGEAIELLVDVPYLVLVIPARSVREFLRDKGFEYLLTDR